VNTMLYEDSTHKNVLLEDSGGNGSAVQANQHLIVHNGEGIILDPGGHKVYNKVLAKTLKELKGGRLKHLFLSHQDPDIVAATNGWLMTTEATAWVSALWTRFVPHFGLDRLVEERLKPIPDQGMRLNLGGSELLILPAHYMHSLGNFQIYDPVSKVLYTGDLGASLGQDYIEVPDFATHLQYMDGFHKRYMTSNKVMKAWAAMVRTLDIEIIAPQHGALFRGKDKCNQFIDWIDDLQCGTDLLMDIYKVP